MILVDVKIFVHAFRADTSEHQTCRTWLDGVVNGDARYGMAPQVLCGVIRITTSSQQVSSAIIFGPISFRSKTKHERPAGFHTVDTAMQANRQVRDLRKRSYSVDK